MKSIMNIPNKLTIARVIMVPVYLVVLYFWSPYAAFAVFILASLTDLLDGYLARKNNEITDFGKFMDPLADKLLVTAALVAFVGLGQLPAWVAIVVVGRDLAVDGLRMVAASKNVVMAAGQSGKIKTAVTMVAIPIMLVEPVASLGVGIFTVNNLCVLAILVLNAWSMIDYFVKNGKLLLK